MTTTAPARIKLANREARLLACGYKQDDIDWMWSRYILAPYSPNPLGPEAEALRVVERRVVERRAYDEVMGKA